MEREKMNKDIRISLLIKMVSNSFERDLTNNVNNIGLTSSQCNILGYLEENSDREINPVDIERDLNLKRSTVTGILQRLEEKGFIDLVASSSKDKRFKKIVFTE